MLNVQVLNIIVNLWRRVLAEFQSRKAQRILLRDRDMLKYLMDVVVGFHRDTLKHLHSVSVV